MKRSPWAVGIILLAAAAVRAEPLIFSAIGCGPYKPAEEPLLEKQLELVGADGKSEFLIHLGDIVSGLKRAWPESEYIKVANILKKSKTPVLIVPGDNEWNDLLNPDEGWKFWTRHFMHFEKNFKGAPKLTRQDVRPENFAFVSKGVLVLGINLVGGRVHDAKEWATRHAQNVAWVQAQMNQHKDNVRAAVILAQATPNKTHESFTTPFAKVAKEFAKPVLLLHADGHKWEVHKKWMAPNVLRVQTDMIGIAPPVLVTVTDDAMEPFVFDRRLKKK